MMNAEPKSSCFSATIEGACREPGSIVADATPLKFDALPGVETPD
jgi:hypothetical protein